MLTDAVWFAYEGAFGLPVPRTLTCTPETAAVLDALLASTGAVVVEHLAAGEASLLIALSAMLAPLAEAPLAVLEVPLQGHRILKGAASNAKSLMALQTVYVV